MPRLLSVLLLGCQLAAWGQQVHPVTGRPIAGVMGPAGAGWLVRSERETEEHPDEALDAIGIRPGQVVADVGAGVGYFTWRLAERVGPSGKVYANDIQPAMLDELRQNMRQRGLTNYVAVLGASGDPRLPFEMLDLVLLVDVYHEFSQPRKMLDHIRESLKSGGRLVLLEYRKEDPAVPIRPEHKMSVAEVKAEVEPEGFRLAQTIEALPRQHILVFKLQSQRGGQN